MLVQVVDLATGRSLVYSSVGWIVPDDLRLLFAAPHFCSDICLFIEWVPPVGLNLY